MEVIGPQQEGLLQSQRGQPWNERQPDPSFESLPCPWLAVTFVRLHHLAEVQAPHLRDDITPQVRDDITVSDCLWFTPVITLSFPVNKTSRAHLNSGKMGLPPGLRDRHASAFWSMRCRRQSAGRFSSCGGRWWWRTSACVTPSSFECSYARMRSLGTTAATSWLWGERPGEPERCQPRVLPLLSPLGIHGTVYIQISWHARDIDPYLYKLLLTMFSVTCNQKMVLKLLFF